MDIWVFFQGIFQQVHTFVEGCTAKRQLANLFAHKVFHISSDEKRKVSLPVATVLSCVAGMAFNVVADPVVGYFYKTYILGVPQSVASIWAKMGAITTLVNAIVAVIVASVFYLALRPALKRTNLLPPV